MNSEQKIEEVPRTRLPYLDGIRGLAALYVMLTHVWVSSGSPSSFSFLKFGDLAVVAFIVLSGYSLMLPISKSSGASLRDVGNYFRRRAKRILPPYYAALAISVGIALVFPAVNSLDRLIPGIPKNWPTENALFFDLIAHLLLLHNLFPRFNYSFDGPLWSVATEWQIYFIFPLLLLPLRARLGGFVPILVGFAFFLLARFDQQLWQACPWFVGSFAVGMLASDMTYVKRSWGKYSLAICLSSGAIFAAVHRHHFHSLALQLVLPDFISSIMFGALLVYLSTAQGSPLYRFFVSKPLTLLGEFSYSLYLMHGPLLSIFSSHFGQGGLKHFLQLIACTPIVLAICYLFHLAFERPFMRWKHPASASEGLSPERVELFKHEALKVNLDMDIVGSSTSQSSERQQPSALAIAVILALICFSEFHILRLIHSGSENFETTLAYGILHGTPIYRVFQSRLLGPMFVEGIVLVTKHSFLSAYRLALFVLVSASILLCYFLIRKLGGRVQDALIWATVYATAVIAFQDYLSFYIFDAVDLSTILLFAYAVLYRNNDLRLLIPLFFVELLNREAAGYIALWLILSAAGDWFNDPDEASRKLLVLRASIGAVLFLFGTWWTHKIRAILFHHSSDPKIGLDLAHKSNGEQFVLKVNLSGMLHGHNPSGFAMALICCGGIVYMLQYLLKRNGKSAYPFVVLMTVMAVSVWCFGLADETRVWLNFIPFFLFTGFIAFKSSQVNPPIPGS